jgi:hypothetical protein
LQCENITINEEEDGKETCHSSSEIEMKRIERKRFSKKKITLFNKYIFKTKRMA